MAIAFNSSSNDQGSPKASSTSGSNQTTPTGGASAQIHPTSGGAGHQQIPGADAAPGNPLGQYERILIRQFIASIITESVIAASPGNLHHGPCPCCMLLVLLWEYYM